MENEIKQARGTGRERVYNFIVDFTKKNCYAPSVKEICVGADLNSESSVYHHLLKLEEEGKIEMRRGYSPRAIKLVGYELRKVEDSANGNE